LMALVLLGMLVPVCPMADVVPPLRKGRAPNVQRQVSAGDDREDPRTEDFTPPTFAESEAEALREPLKAAPPKSVVLGASMRAINAPVAIMEILAEQFLTPEVTSLAAGCSFWPPPPEAMEELVKMASSGDPDLHRYGDCRGIPELREALKEKLANENNITEQEIMITAGANQAFMNAVLATCDAGDAAILFTPYYFSHRVALELAGVEPIEVDCDDFLNPDPYALQEAFVQAAKLGRNVRMVVMCNPGNPSGAVMPKEQVDRIMTMCRDQGVWLVSDETYEYFTYDGATHHSPVSPEGVINIFSFSKAYGMAGWRVGYLAYPSYIHDEILKAQDTIPTMATIISQRMALAALRAGPAWVRKQVYQLALVRELLWETIEPLNPVFGQGAFYFFVRLPSMVPEEMAIEVIARRHNLLLCPGSAFGMPGYVRIAYGNVRLQEAEDVAERLTNAMSEMVKVGMRLSYDAQMADPMASGREGDWGPLMDENMAESDENQYQDDSDANQGEDDKTFHDTERGRTETVDGTILEDET